MPVPAQTPKLTNTEWLVFISDNAFNTIYDVYLRNFESYNRKIKEYSVLWFRQIWRTINYLASMQHKSTTNIYNIENTYNSTNPSYGKIQFETKIFFFYIRWKIL